jgi:hypothetical protein
MAIAHFSDVTCSGCGFVAENVYGARCAGLIEIHHLKPFCCQCASVREALCSLSELSSGRPLGHGYAFNFARLRVTIRFRHRRRLRLHLWRQSFREP